MAPRVPLAGLVMVAGLAGAVLVSGCGSSPPRRAVTVTVDPSSSAAIPARSTAASPSPRPTHLTRLPGSCDTRLTDFLVFQALGGRQLAGRDAFVVGRPDPGIGRLGYLNCRYGVTGSGGGERTKVEIGVSLYRTAAQAAKRIAATIDDYTAQGATPIRVTVSGRPATLLTGGRGAGYTLPLLVTGSGQRTIAVTLDPSVATGAAVAKDSAALAAVAVQRTGG